MSSGCFAMLRNHAGCCAAPATEAATSQESSRSGKPPSLLGSGLRARHVAHLHDVDATVIVESDRLGHQPVTSPTVPDDLARKRVKPPRPRFWTQARDIDDLASRAISWAHCRRAVCLASINTPFSGGRWVIATLAAPYVSRHCSILAILTRAISLNLWRSVRCPGLRIAGRPRTLRCFEPSFRYAATRSAPVRCADRSCPALSRAAAASSRIGV